MLGFSSSTKVSKSNKEYPIIKISNLSRRLLMSNSLSIKASTRHKFIIINMLRLTDVIMMGMLEKSSILAIVSVSFTSNRISAKIHNEAVSIAPSFNVICSSSLNSALNESIHSGMSVDGCL